jgi:methyl-accepting chemotaxis protein
MFSAIGILTGATVYIVVAGSSEGAAESRSSDLAVGRTFRLRDKVEPQLPEGRMTKANAPVEVLRESQPSEDFRTWLYNNPPSGPSQLVSPPTVAGLNIATVRGRAEAVSTALDGDLFVNTDLPDNRTMVAVLLVGEQGIKGVLLSISERPEEVQSALQALAGQRLTALVVAVLVAGLIGFLVASLITSRVKRLAAAAGELAEGHLDTPVYPSGRDEIGDLGRTLDSMRIALAETFDAL